MTKAAPREQPRCDGLLILGLSLISFACLLWLNFMIFAITGGVGFALYPASEHALLLLWGIALVSQSQLAQTGRQSQRPPLLLSGPALWPMALTLSVLIVAAVVTGSPLVLILTWLGLAIALLMALLACASTLASASSTPTAGRLMAAAALLCGWLGAILMALSHALTAQSALLATLAKLLVFDALPQLMLLALWAPSGPVAALFLGSILAEASGQPSVAYALRGAAIALAILPRLKALDPSLQRFWQRLVAAFWLGGTLAIAFWPELTIHLKHFIYFGVYLTLAALALAAPLALVPPMTPKRFHWVVGLVALGALTRATAFVSHASYTRHLGYAALIVLIALGLAIPAYRRWQRRRP